MEDFNITIMEILNFVNESDLGYNQSEPQSDMHINQTFAIGHIITVVLFNLCCLIGNGATIFIQLKHYKKYKSKLYKISLALVDIMACGSVLPLTIFYFTGTDGIYTAKWRVSLGSFAFSANINILVLEAFNRFLALYFPFQYKKGKMIRSAIGMAFVMIIELIASVLIFRYTRSEHKIDPGRSDNLIQIVTMGRLLISWILIIVLYILIIFKIYKQERSIASSTNNKKVNNADRKAQHA